MQAVGFYDIYFRYALYYDAHKIVTIEQYTM